MNTTTINIIEEEEWSDDSSYESNLFTRRRSNWKDIMKRQDIMKRRDIMKRQDIKKEKCDECVICYESFTSSIPCSTTPCGHKFHSSCLFQNFEHRPECPLCRTELIKQKEEENDDDDSSYYSEEEQFKQIVSIKQMADKLQTLGYPFTYITTIGLYNDADDLLAVAKLSKPIKKTPSTELVVKIKLDI